MTRRNLVMFALVMISAVAFGQGFSEEDAAAMAGMNFEWSAKLVKAAPATSTTTARTTKSVSVNQLAKASARKSSTTSSTRSTRRAATSQQTYAAAPAQQYSAPQYTAPQSDVQQQLQAAVAANSRQQVIVGTVEHNYIDDYDGNTTLVINTGYQILRFSMRGYRDVVIPVHQGDYVAFVVTYGMNSMSEYPIVRYNELLNVTGTNRHMENILMHQYGGNTAAMLANMPNATKWQKIASNISAGIFTVASIAQGVRVVRDLFRH